MYVVPWSVTLGNQTKVQPPNASIKSDEIAGQGYSVYSQILFLVPNGIYNYTLNQNGSGYYPFVVSSGTVSVSGSNVTVKVGPPEVYCTAASSTSSTITTTCSAGYVNGTCGPMTTTTTTLFDGASYCLSSNKCSTLYPLGRSLLLQNNLVVSARFSSHAVEDKHIGQLRSFLFSRTGSAARTIVRVN